jgi:hypothetical protein
VRRDLPASRAGDRRRIRALATVGLVAGSTYEGGDMGVLKTLKTLIKLGLGLSITFAALGAVLAFGMFAWLGMPLLAVGLGVLSSAIGEIDI